MFSSADALLRGTEHGSAVISRDLRGGGAKTLSDLRRDVHALASFLSSWGISRAAIVTDDTYLFETAFFACAAAGTVPVLPASVSEGYLSRCQRLFDAVLAEDCAVSGRDGTFSIAMLAAEYEPRGAMPPVSDTSPYMMFTSGSTGAPKLVTHTFSDLFLEARAAFRLLSGALSRSDFACATVPCRHAFGLAFRVMMPLLTLLPASVRCAVYEEEFTQDPAEDELCTVPGDLLETVIDLAMAIERKDYSFVSEESSHFAEVEPGDKVDLYGARKIMEEAGFQTESVYTVGYLSEPLLFVHENEVILLGSRRFDGETLYLEMKRLFYGVERKAVACAVEKLREDCLPVEIIECDDGSWSFRGEMDDDVDTDNFLDRLESDVELLRKAVSRVEECEGVGGEPWSIMRKQRQLFIHEVIDASVKLKALNI